MKTLLPPYKNPTELRHAARETHLRYKSDRLHVRAMRELGAPEVLCIRLQRDLRAANMTHCAVFRDQRRIILKHLYPEEVQRVRATVPRATPRPNLRKQHPAIYERRKTMLRRAKDRLCDGRITLEQWREFEAQVKAWCMSAYDAMRNEQAQPEPPAYPVNKA